MADTNKLSDFLTANKLDGKRLLAVSHKLETLQRDDRAIKLSKRQGKKAEAAGTANGEKKEAGKPRSGRPITSVALANALAGKSVSGPTKQRFLRAVNFLLEQKKKDKVELKSLF